MVEANFGKLTTLPGRVSGVYLGDMIDTSILVNRHMLRQNGVDPDAVRVEYDPTYVGASTFPEGIVIGPKALAFIERNPEYGYVLFAHELTHLTQPEPSSIMYQTAAGRPTRFHSRSFREQEAIFWESQQAARFGWSREEYEAFTEELYDMLDAPPQYQKHVEIEKRERAYAALPVMSRRPEGSASTHPPGFSNRDVKVRGHRRRA
jgi:hypothetical protein